MITTRAQVDQQREARGVGQRRGAAARSRSPRRRGGGGTRDRARTPPASRWSRSSRRTHRPAPGRPRCRRRPCGRPRTVWIPHRDPPARPIRRQSHHVEVDAVPKRPAAASTGGSESPGRAEWTARPTVLRGVVVEHAYCQNGLTVVGFMDSITTLRCCTTAGFAASPRARVPPPTRPRRRSPPSRGAPACRRGRRSTASGRQLDDAPCQAQPPRSTTACEPCTVATPSTTRQSVPILSRPAP